MKIVDIDGPELMKSARPYFIYPGFAFVAYPNRDSSGYKERYGIPEAETVIRGTLRYQGFPEFVKALVDIGFLSEEQKDFLAPGSNIAWKDAFAKILGISSSKEEYSRLISTTDDLGIYYSLFHRKRNFLLQRRNIGLFLE